MNDADGGQAPHDPGRQRADAMLRRLVPGLSRQQARELCAIGAVAIDAVVADARTRAATGATVRWYEADPALSLQLGLPVVHRAAGVLVLHKPPGLAVHAGPVVDDSVADRLAHALPDAGLCQRLDRLASGLLLCGEGPQARQGLSTAMEHGRIEREYLAVAAGVVDGDERTIDLPLRSTDEPQGNRPKVVVDREHGQRSVTHCRVVERSPRATLLRIRLETGRTHQIRAHLLAIGHPLLGDPRYGDPALNAAARATFGVDRPLLHCARLCWPAGTTDGDAGADVRAFVEPDLARVFPRAFR